MHFENALYSHIRGSVIIHVNIVFPVTAKSKRNTTMSNRANIENQLTMIAIFKSVSIKTIH